jgi:hypothetical protein
MGRSKLRVIAFAMATAAFIMPARAATQEPEEKVTVAEAGVQVSITADRWTGRPAELTQVIPLLVSIENNSSTPLRLRYEQFGLRTPAGKWLPALPPFEIEGEEAVPLNGPYPYPVSGFYIAPYLGRYYPFFTPFAGPFYYDPLYYSSFYPSFASVSLPTGDMVQKALPEGVLEPGGRITGFVYFETGNFDPDRGTFAADLIDAKTLRRVGRVEGVLEID